MKILLVSLLLLSFLVVGISPKLRNYNFNSQLDSAKKQAENKINQQVKNTQNEITNKFSDTPLTRFGSQNVLEIKTPNFINISDLQINEDSKNISYLIEPIQIIDNRSSQGIGDLNINISVSDLTSGKHKINSKYIYLTIKDKKRFQSMGVNIKDGNPLEINFITLASLPDKKLSLTPILKINLPQDVHKGSYSGEISTEIN